MRMWLNLASALPPVNGNDSTSCFAPDPGSPAGAFLARWGGVSRTWRSGCSQQHAPTRKPQNPTPQMLPFPMPPPRASSADTQTAPQIAASIQSFLEAHSEAAILEDGRVLFDLRTAKYTLSTDHDRCTLHLWSSEANMVRRILSTQQRSGTLRLSTQRFGQSQPRLLELVASRDRRTPTTRETSRTRYLRTLERILQRQFADWKPDSFRTAMDLEQSFGPAYVRGSLLKGQQAWAVIGVSEAEAATTIDGILTLGILWLHHCREHAAGRRLYQGLKLILPHGTSQLTLSRLAWLNPDAAQWELYELDQSTEELTLRDPADQGNLRSHLIHLPDEAAARERFAEAITLVTALVPESDRERITQRLRSTAELAFLLHGLEFARARIGLSATSFAHTLEITVGTGPSETPLTPANRDELASTIAELFDRRRAFAPSVDFGRRATASRIGSTSTTTAAHSRIKIGSKPGAPANNPTQDPLYRAAPERWLESVLRADLAPLTRSLAPAPHQPDPQPNKASANDPDPDTLGNRAETTLTSTIGTINPHDPRAIPRLDPRHVYAQVPAIAGASDRGLLDLLGVTADGRLAVIELKADDDLHLALQGLDYWIRVRHHHLQTADNTGLGEFQRHGYFRGIELSPLPPRLYLVAPALHIHPATETVLRYLSPRVDWNLLALDERWRQQIRVVWRKQSGR